MKFMMHLNWPIVNLYLTCLIIRLCHFRARSWSFSWSKAKIINCSCYFRKPGLLLLDEASSNLDKESENKIIDTLFKLKGKMTIIIVSHKNTMDKVADSFLIFKAPNKIKAIINKN